jgi:hypothetical protein
MSWRRLRAAAVPLATFALTARARAATLTESSVQMLAPETLMLLGAMLVFMGLACRTWSQNPL